MPLILSAIDYKLAPTYSEMVTRKRRFDALSAILHQCRTIYEISDLALACINQMLQFAYAITRDIFLSGKKYVTIYLQFVSKPLYTAADNEYLVAMPKLTNRCQTYP